MSHKLHVVIEDRRYSQLRELSSESGASIGELVRRALSQAYEGRTDKERRLASFRAGVGAWANRPEGADTYEEIRKLSPRIRSW